MNYQEMTLLQLRDVAKELGIKGVTGLKKGELVELLSNASKVKKRPQTEATTQETKAEKKIIHKKPEQPVNKAEEQTDKKPAKVTTIDPSLDSGKEANGILEVMNEGYGFIRCENYLPGENDIYVSPVFKLKRLICAGDT